MIDAKKEGTDIPNTEISKINLSKKVSLYSADRTPKINPKAKAKKIAANAKTKVFLKVFTNIFTTGVPVLTKESRRQGTLRTKV